jgi:hypothetical protein
MSGWNVSRDFRALHLHDRLSPVIFCAVLKPNSSGIVLVIVYSLSQKSLYHVLNPSNITTSCVFLIFVVAWLAVDITHFVGFQVNRMADESPFTIEEMLLMPVWVYRRQNNGKTQNELLRDFKALFIKILHWSWQSLFGSSFFRMGTIQDAPRSGRQWTRSTRSNEFLASIEQSPTKSICRCILNVSVCYIRCAT